MDAGGHRPGGRGRGRLRPCQRVASNAAQVRKGALDMAVSVDYYGKLEKSARMAGITMGEVTAGISRAHDKVLGAAIGGNIGESMFLESWLDATTTWTRVSATPSIWPSGSRA